VRAVLLVLVVGCASQDAPLTVDVVTSPTSATWYISPGASCTCQNVATFPTSGTCSHDSDTPGCTCYPGACLTHIDVMQAGAVVDSVQASTYPEPETFGGLPGDFTQPDLSLRFAGCGEDAVVELTNQFPTAVTATASPDQKQLSWPVVPNDGFLVDVAGEYVGELCRTAPDASSQTIDLGYYTSYSVLTLRGPTTTSSGSFTFHLWSTH
jgi:hypothetical protein